MLKLLNKSVKKSLCFIPQTVHQSLLIDKKIGVSVCDINFCLCDNVIDKIFKEQNIKKINISIKKEEEKKFSNFKCD